MQTAQPCDRRVPIFTAINLARDWQPVHLALFGGGGSGTTRPGFRSEVQVLIDRTAGTRRLSTPQTLVMNEGRPGGRSVSLSRWDRTCPGQYPDRDFVSQRLWTTSIARWMVQNPATAMIGEAKTQRAINQPLSPRRDSRRNSGQQARIIRN